MALSGYMDIYQFILMDKDDKTTAIWDGDCISIRSEPGYRCLLFNLGTFFVEVRFDVLENTITRFVPFKTTELLEPYLDQIYISEVQYLL